MTRPTWIARVVLEVPLAEEREHLRRVLAAETGRGGGRTRVAVAVQRSELVLSVEADDTSALRAGLNTELSWLQLSLATAEVVRSRRPASATHSGRFAEPRSA